MKSQSKISPFLWFDNNAEEAMKFYTSIFKNSAITSRGTFQLEGQEFMVLNGGPQFKFNEAISFFVKCETQEEVDDLWEKLIAGGGAPGRCGWLKDKFGLSWQIIPTVFMKLVSDPDPAKSQRVIQAMLKMQKMDIKKLQEAYDQE
jgi:predicted 3-demethylubiquinone-9 3-methyltransferase (glyoxalase superfamily)